MTILDDLSGLQQAAVAVGGIAGSIYTGWLLARRQRSKTNSAVAKDESDIAESRAGTGLLHTLQAERDALMQRLQEISEAREKQFGACEERVRSLSEQVLDLRLANGRLLQELALHDKSAAERMLLLQVRPGPPGKGDEPP